MLRFQRNFVEGLGRANGQPMVAQGLDETRAYYDEFAQSYERERRPHVPHGYHALLDDLQVEVVRRYGTGKDILECGCGTGLLLERFRIFARQAKGMDLSPGMLAMARERGLDVVEGSVTELPFEKASFDVTCSFKVLAHVEDIGRALGEMARVTRPGGVVVAEFYNPISLRGLAKLVGPAGNISGQTKESAVYTRFDPPWRIPRLLPPGLRVEAVRGIRIVTPFAQVHQVPLLGRWVQKLERGLADTKAAYLAGFFVVVLRKLP